MNTIVHDKNLEKLIRQSLNKPEGELTPDDLAEIQTLKCPLNTILTDVRGLEYCVNLRELSLCCDSRYGGCIGNFIEDITPLAGLTKLTRLEVDNHHIRDITPLAGLTNLTYLGLNSNDIEDISPLANLKNLQVLYLTENILLHDTKPLEQLENLTGLSIWSVGLPHLPCPEKIESLSFISPVLTEEDIFRIGGFTGLKRLNLGGCLVESLSGLERLTGLVKLSLNGKRMADISPLAALHGLRSLSIIGGTGEDEGIVDITPLASLQSLEELSLRQNKIRNIAPLVNLIQLTDLDLSHNQIEDISPLEKIVNLKYLNLAHNYISDFHAVENLPELISCNKSGNCK